MLEKRFLGPSSASVTIDIPFGRVGFQLYVVDFSENLKAVKLHPLSFRTVAAASILAAWYGPKSDHSMPICFWNLEIFTGILLVIRQTRAQNFGGYSCRNGISWNVPCDDGICANYATVPYLYSVV